MQKNQLSLLAASVALAASTLLGTVRAAEPPSSPVAAHAPMARHHGHDFMRSMQQLHDQLKLSPPQEQAWQQALAHMKRNRQALHENMGRYRALRDSMQHQRILDLSSLRAQRDKIFADNQRLRADTEDQWLAFYNGLNDNQKATVSAAIEARMAKMKAWREHHRAHRHWHHQEPGAPAGASQPSAQQ